MLGNTRLLKILKFSPLPQDLAAHVLYFGADCLKLHPAICSLNVLFGKPVLSVFNPKCPKLNLAVS
jgi:hypothetical protein